MFLLRKRYAMPAVAAVLLAAGIIALRVDAGAVPSAGEPPAAAVDVATVASRSITDWHEFSGRLEAIDRVEIRPLVSGTLTAVHFKDGSLMRRGDLLFTIDPRPYQASVDQAKARLAAAQARAAYTASDLSLGSLLLAVNAHD